MNKLRTLKRLCEQVKKIKKVMPWNSYPKHVRNFLLKRLHSNGRKYD